MTRRRQPEGGAPFLCGCGAPAIVRVGVCHVYGELYDETCLCEPCARNAHVARAFQTLDLDLPKEFNS
jgi:hypothetical protein